MIENVLLGLGVWACICVIWFNVRDIYKKESWWELPIAATCFIILIVWYFLSDLFSKWSNGK